MSCLPWSFYPGSGRVIACARWLSGALPVSDACRLVKPLMSDSCWTILVSCRSCGYRLLMARLCLDIGLAMLRVWVDANGQPGGRAQCVSNVADSSLVPLQPRVEIPLACFTGVKRSPRREISLYCHGYYLSATTCRVRAASQAVDAARDGRVTPQHTPPQLATI